MRETSRLQREDQDPILWLPGPQGMAMKVPLKEVSQTTASARTEKADPELGAIYRIMGRKLVVVDGKVIFKSLKTLLHRGRTSVDIIKSGGYKISGLEIESVRMPRSISCTKVTNSGRDLKLGKLFCLRFCFSMRKSGSVLWLASLTKPGAKRHPKDLRLKVFSDSQKVSKAGC